MIKCSQCGGTELEQGTLYGFDTLKFRSVEGSGINTIPVAYMCHNCGHIELFSARPEQDEE